MIMMRKTEKMKRTEKIREIGKHKEKKYGWEITTRNLIYRPMLIGLLLMFLAAPVLASDSWTLSFDIKASWYSNLERLEIYVDNTKVRQIDADSFSNDVYDVNAPVNPTHVNVDLSSYATQNSRVKIRLYKIAGSGKPWVLLNNVAILHNGKDVRFTDWTVNKNPAGTGLELKQIYGDEQRLVLKYADGTVGAGDYAEFVSAPLQDSAELEIKPSDISFTPETPISSVPKDVVINARVRNTGGLDTGNTVKMELWVNDVKQGETSQFSVQAGGSQTQKFSYNYAGGLDKVEIRVVSTDDARAYNNRAIRYLTSAKPYLLFKNFADTPISKYANNEPYKTWRDQITSYADGYKSDPGTYGYKIKYLAGAYLITNDKSYADAATNALLNINAPSSPSFAAHPYLDLEDNLGDYIESFDLLREYIYTNRNTDYFTIQNRLADMASDAKWRAFNYYAWDFLEAFPREAMLGDVNNHIISENSVLISAASGLLDYHGDKMDDLDAPDTAQIALKNMFGESYLGAPLPVARLVNGEGGYGIQGQYRFQYAEYLANAMAIYNSVYGNPVKMYPLAYGVLDMPAWYTLPAGCEPPGKGLTSGSYSWGEEYILAGLFDGQDRNNHMWYINNVLKQSICSESASASIVDKGLLYDSSYTSPAQPSWGKTDSYFSDKNAVAILRKGYAPDYDSTYLRLIGHKDSVWGNAETTHSYQGSYTMWSKNAYLVAARGDERGWTKTIPELGGFGYSSFIFNDNLALSELEQFGAQSNPATLDEYISSPGIDAAHMKTSVTKLENVYSSDTTSSNIKWDRNVLFPSMEYYIIADHLVSDSSYNFDMTVHYGGTEPDTSATADDSNYPVKGNLKIDGQNVDWWGGNQKVTRNTNSVRWSTKSLSAIQSDIPLPQHDVEAITYIAPATAITNNRSVQQFGTYAKPSGLMWHPYILSRQSGKDVKYLTVQYPRDITAGEAEPSIQQIPVTGGSDGDYAIKLTRGTVKDIASISNGESITADSMGTDAKIAFSRYDGSLRYFLMKDGSTFSYGGAEKVHISKPVSYFILNYNDAGVVSFKIKGSGTVTITLRGMADESYSVIRDGMPYSDVSKSGSDLIITTDLSEHVFKLGSQAQVLEATQTPEMTPTPTSTAQTPTPAPTQDQTSAPAPAPDQTTQRIYYFDAESGQDGWQTEGLWHITGNRYNSPGHSFWYGKEDTKTYNTGSANSGSLISPEITLSGSQAELYFWSWYQTEPSNTYDRKLIQISADGGPWTDLKQIIDDRGTWNKESIDLSNYAGKKIRLRFFFDTGDGNMNDYEGWYVDDIEIRANAAPSQSSLGSIYYFDAESGQDSWQTESLWHVTGNRYNSPGHSFWYGKEDTKTYNTGSANSGGLTSPEINLGSGSQPVLYFWSWYQTEPSNTYDRKLVQISADGGPWTDLKQITDDRGTWNKESIDLSNYAGKKIRLRFFFDTGDGNMNDYEGWYVDDVEIV